MFTFKSPATLAIAVMIASVPATVLAHHSFAMFDREKLVTLKGTVKQFQWTNPHVWVQVMVPNDKGVAEEWSIEGASPNMLFRQGWDDKTFKPGDQVQLVINPLRNGGHGGSFVAGTLPSGKTLGNLNARAPG